MKSQHIMAITHESTEILGFQFDFFSRSTMYDEEAHPCYLESSKAHDLQISWK